MATYRSKPTTIEATQWNADGDHEAVKRFDGFGAVFYCVELARGGMAKVSPGDWIIAEPDGSGFYPCPADVFAAKYEAVNG